MKRKPYKPSALMVTSLAMAAMRDIAFVQLPAAARRTISLQDRIHDDDACIARAEAKRQRKAAKRLGK